MADCPSNGEAAFRVCVELKKTASVFATLRAIFHLENQSSKTRRCLFIALATSLGSVRVVCRSDRFSQFRVWLRPRRVLIGFASSCCPAPPQFWASFSCWPPSLFAIHSEQKRPLAVDLIFVRSSPCAGSEASRVRTGQWGSPIVKKTASVFATLRAIFHLENQSSKTRRCLLIALATSLGSVWDAKIAVSSANMHKVVLW
ncbi:hypothetical protein TNCV_4505131 [Trichonephila clavipes]|nr:hypothetical protein TNCV_4505131 [Trichonephila clavipes]